MRAPRAYHLAMASLLFALVLDLVAPTRAAAPTVRLPAHVCDGPGGLDVDGDGVAERFEVVPDSCGTGGCVYTVFLARRPWRAAGVIDGCWFAVGAQSRHGAADIVAVWRLGANAHRTARYRFDGHRYQPLRRHPR